MHFTLEEQKEEIRRELALRKEVYPKLIKQQKLTTPEANRRYACLRAIIPTLDAAIERRDGKQLTID